MASITNVINVSLLAEGQAAQADNPNNVMVITKGQDVLSSSERYRTYKTAADVATDFGSASEEAAFANVVFGTRPNAIDAGGSLAIGYWRGTAEPMAASQAVLTGAELDEETVVAALQQVSDGALTIEINSVDQEVTGLDFQTITTLQEAVDLVAAALTAVGTVLGDDDRIRITTIGSGAEYTLAFPVAPASGTNVAPMLGLSASAGATLVQGGDASAASPATLINSIALTADDLSALKLISDGSFTIDIDGIPVEITGLDFDTVASWAEVAAIIDAALNAAGVAVSAPDTTHLLSQTDDTGATATLSSLYEAASGTFIGAILNLDSASTPTLVQGADAATVAPEAKTAALTAIRAEFPFKGFCFIDGIDDEEVPAVAAWAVANKGICYEVFGDPDNLEVDPDNPVWAVKLAGQTSFRCLYSAANNQQLAASYMARVHTTNFAGENTASTIHLKALAVPAETYGQTVIESAKRVGLDLFTTIKDVSVVLSSGANGFVDNVYNLDAFVEQLQTDLFNALAGTPTKIPQTQAGVDTLLDVLGKTCRQYVRAGVFAPGTWSSSSYFGDRTAFLRGIAEDGYVVGAGDLADQSTADRQARKSPVLQVAVKNAGAIHSADVIINFNL